MADFCNICADKLFGPDVEPEIDVIEADKSLSPRYGVPVLCEGCGIKFIAKNPNGKTYILYGHKTISIDVYKEKLHEQQLKW